MSQTAASQAAELPDQPAGARHSHPAPSPRRGLVVFSARLAAALTSSTLFGLTAAGAFPPWSLLTAFLLAFAFGTFFVGGTGYRILIAVARGRQEPAPASWSGAATGSALLVLALALAAWPAGGAVHVLAGFALAINAAYVLVKTSCALVGCCMVDRRLHPHWPAGLDLRIIEIGVSLVALAVTAGLVLAGETRLAALAGILAHVAMRLVSRWLRGRFSTGWPPLRQPGSELAPLYLLAIAALLTA